VGKQFYLGMALPSDQDCFGLGSNNYLGCNNQGDSFVPHVALEMIEPMQKMAPKQCRKRGE